MRTPHATTEARASREHAALVPSYLGLKTVVAKSFARIHWQNLINFGVLPVTFADPGDYDRIQQSDELEIDRPAEALQRGSTVRIFNKTRNVAFIANHSLSGRQVEAVVNGGLINTVRRRRPS